MRILFAHVPAGFPAGGKSRGAMFNMAMPLGFLALADLMLRSGHEVEVVHAGVEAALDPDFDIAASVAAFDPALLAVSLHFHHQLASARDALAGVKSVSPEVRTVVGGFTASFFYREIMEKWPQADFVVRGDGEAPLFHLARVLDKEITPDSVPNLSFRARGRIVHNHFGYAADETVLDRLRFSNISLLRNRQNYGGGFLFTEKEGIAQYLTNRYFYLCGGRGCSVDCAYCAGAASSQKIISSRKKPLFRTAVSLLGDIRELAGEGIDRFYICFDPPRKNDSPYIELMEKIQKENIEVSMIFETYRGVPTRRFVKMYAETFGKGSHTALVFSPATANEELRRFYNGMYYTNTQLEERLADCARLGVRSVLYFTVFPGETPADVGRSCDWALGLREKYGADSVFIPIEIEPGAPWHLNPARFGIKPTCVTFDDFVAASAARDFSKPITNPGYTFKSFNRIMKLIESKGLAPQGYTVTD